MPTLTFGPFAFDPNTRLLKRDGVELPLPPRVTGVLQVLLTRAGDVVPRQELIDSVWKDAFVTDTSLAEAISVLRQTLGDDPQTPSYIQTLHRRGYRFVAPVSTPVQVTATVAAIPQTAPDSAGPSIPGWLLPWSIAVVCAVLAAVAVRKAVTNRQSDPPPVTRFAVAAAPGTRFDARAPAFALAPDASRIAWSGCDDSGCRLYVRSADRLDAVAIAGTDDAAAPFFSPDGRSIGFFSEGHLKKIALTGGAPVTLADAADPSGGTWTNDGRIIYAGAEPGLRVVRETGGEPAQLTVPQSSAGEVRHVWPALHVTGDRLLFTITTLAGAEGGGRLGLLRLDTRNPSWTMLLGSIGIARSVSEDVVVFSTGTDLQAVTLDARRSAISGAPQTAVANVAAAAGAGQFATAPAGALLAVSAAEEAERPPFFWRSSGAVSDLPLTRYLHSPALSPDGRQIAGVDRNGSRPDIWVADVERGASTRLTHTGVNAAPVWSADGASLFYAMSDGGPFAIYRREASLQQPAQRIHTAREHAIPTSASRDGSLLAFTSRDTTTGADVWGLTLAGGTVAPLIRTSFEDVAAVFSPDGQLLAYQSNESGRWEVYVHRRSDGRRSTVSTDGGTDPFWSTDGRSLFFRSRERLMRASVSQEGVGIGTAELVLRLTDVAPIAADRQNRLLFQRRSRLPDDAAILALQWVREARQLLGPPSAAMPR